jgi:hypothetical protein
LLEDPNQGDPNEELPGYFADGEGGLGYGPDASISTKAPCILRAKHYIVPQWQLRGAVFYAHTKEEPAYRLFPSEIVKLCLTLRCL